MVYRSKNVGMYMWNLYVHVKLIVYNVILLHQEVFLKKREVIYVEISWNYVNILS